jgi:hypothetical protein
MLKENPRSRPNVYQVLREACLMQGLEVPIRDVCNSTQYIIITNVSRSMLAEHNPKFAGINNYRLLKHRLLLHQLLARSTHHPPNKNRLSQTLYLCVGVGQQPHNQLLRSQARLLSEAHLETHLRHWIPSHLQEMWMSCRPDFPV